ncbi:hypothetical protein [Serratia fonticola]
MASEYRITTNFKSTQIYKLVKLLARKNKVSESRFIEEMLRISFDEQLREPEKLLGDGKIGKNRNLLPNNYFSSGLTFNLATLLDGKDYTVSPREIVFDMNFPLIESESFNFNSKTEKSTINRMVIRGEINKRLKSELESYIYDFAYPDAMLFFLTRADVSYKKEKPLFVNIYVTVTVYILPIHLNKKHLEKYSLLDFANITYRQFSNVAKKGWDRSKYSHLLYIDEVSQSKSGGYFIGVLHEQKQFTLEDFKGFEKVKIPTRDKIYFIDFHLDNSRMVIKRNQSKER